MVVPESQVVAAASSNGGDGSDAAVGTTPVSAAAKAVVAAQKAEEEAKAAAEERWAAGRALLHWKEGANPALVENTALLGVGGRNDVPRGERKRVLVPFCGNSKSVDYLALGVAPEGQLQVVAVDPLQRFLTAYADERPALGFTSVDVDPAVDVGADGKVGLTA